MKLTTYLGIFLLQTHYVTDQLIELGEGTLFGYDRLYLAIT